MDKKIQLFYRECYDDALPRIYHTTHYNILNLWSTILENHPIHRTIYPKFHLDIAFYLLTVLIAMSFLSAVIFDHFVFFFGNSLSCGDRTSIFDCSSSKDDITCFWDASKSLCTSKYSDVDADNIIWCALFLTLLSIPVIQILWFCNLYFIKLLAAPYDEIKKSKIVIVSDRSLSNPHSSSNRKISFEKNVFTSVIQQEYSLFHHRLEKELLQHPIFSNVWRAILGNQSPSPADIESGVSKSPSLVQREEELTRQRQFSLRESDIKKIIALSIKTTQAEIKKQIALETRILRTPRNSSVMPQVHARNLNSISDLSHHPGHPVLDHFASTSITDLTAARLLQSNRVFIERFKVTRHLYLFLRDSLPLDARYLLDFQIYIRSFFTSIFTDPDTEFHDLLHFEHRDWRLRVRVKFVLAFSYCALIVFMGSYFFLFVTSCIVRKRSAKLSAAVASLGLWIVFTGAVIQPLITIVAQYLIPRMISHDVHSARRNCLKTLKDHYFQQLVKESYEREVCSFGYTPPLPSSSSSSSQLLLASQRFSSEYSEAYESPLIEKYRPLSFLTYPLIQLYLPLPYTMDMMKLLLEAEQVEVGALSLESNSPSLSAYWMSQPPYLPSETPQEKVDDDDVDPTTPHIPITAAPSRSARFDHPENDISCRDLLQNQWILKEKEISQSLESFRSRLSQRCSLRFAISSLIRLYFLVTKSLSPSSASFYSAVISFRAIEIIMQTLLLIFLIGLVQLHEVLFFLHPMLALAPVVLLGWVCVVYYFILHTAYRNIRERRSPCHCSDRQVLTNLSISVLLQCGCLDCQYCNSFGMEIECDYCQIRPIKPITFNRSVLQQQLHATSSTSASSPPSITLTPKQLLSLESDVSSHGGSRKIIEVYPRSVHPDHRLSSDEEEYREQETRGSEYPSPSPQRSRLTLTPQESGFSSSPEKSRLSLSPQERDSGKFSEDDSRSSLESSGDFDGANIVIRVPGKKDLQLSSRQSANHEEHIQEWIQEHNGEWNESEIPMPPVPTRKQSLQDPIVCPSLDPHLQQEQEQEQDSPMGGTITPTMLNLFSGTSYDAEMMSAAARSPSTSFDFPRQQSPNDSHRTPSIDSYLKALELRESYHSDRMTQYQDMILQKTAAKLHLKNRRGAKSRGEGGGSAGNDSSSDGFESSDRGGSSSGGGGVGDEEARTTSRSSGTEQTLNTLKTRLIKTPRPLSPTNSAAAAPAPVGYGTPKERVSSSPVAGSGVAIGRGGGAVTAEAKESLVKSRVVKTDFETHISGLNESIEKEKYRSQELLARRLQQKKEKELRLEEEHVSA
jgi:hypothetical protein